MAFNKTDGWSPGIIIYSIPIPKKTFEFQLMPLWGTRTNELTGFANFSYYIHPKTGIIREYEVYFR